MYCSSTPTAGCRRFAARGNPQAGTSALRFDASGRCTAPCRMKDGSYNCPSTERRMEPKIRCTGAVVKRVAVAVAALAALGVGPVLAADMRPAPLYKAPPPPVWSWTGCHAGLNVGGGRTHETAVTT